jgi:hypothetical protein
MSNWMGLTLPRTAPKATQTEATQKSALMRLWEDRPGRVWGLEFGLWFSVDLGLYFNLFKPQFCHLQ